MCVYAYTYPFVCFLRRSVCTHISVSVLANILRTNTQTNTVTDYTLTRHTIAVGITVSLLGTFCLVPTVGG